MTPDTWQKANEALKHLLSLEDDQQHAYREQLHRNNPEIASAIDVLLSQRSEEFSMKTVAKSMPVASADDTVAHFASPESEPITVHIPDYEILSELGRGGMGVVYEARHIGLKRLVALKMILAGEHAGAVQLARFRDEAQAVARLQHPNIVQIYEIGEHDGLPFFSLEYCGGGSLRDALDGTPWDPKEAAQLIRVLAEAMQTAHGAQIIHRDLKPRNVLRTTDGTLKIADFGLAKKLDDADGHTATGSIMGTPSYMAPEQAKGDPSAIGPSADIYALGVMTYELIVGRTPFCATTPMDTIFQLLHSEPVSPRRLQPKVPKDLETICLKCLEKNPAKRYGSAAELADDLGHFLANRTISARPVSYATKVWRWCRRNPSGALAIAAVVALFSILVPSLLLFNLAKQRQETAEAKATAATDLAQKESLLRQAREREAVAAKKARDEALKRELLTKQLAATEKYNNLLNQVRLRKLRRPSGWTWANIKDLSQLAKLAVRERDDYTLRCELAATIGGVDVRPQKMLLKDFEANCVAFSPDGTLLAVAPHRVPGWLLPSHVLLLDVKKGDVVRKLRFSGALAYRLSGSLAPDGVRSMTFNGNGKTLAIGTRSGNIFCWNLDDSKSKPINFRVTANRSVGRLNFSATGQLLSETVLPDKNALAAFRVIESWDLAKKTRQAVLKAGGAARFCLTADRKLLVAHNNKQLEFYNTNTLKQSHAVPCTRDLSSIDAAHPNGSIIAGKKGEQVFLVGLKKTDGYVRSFHDPGHGTSHLESRIEGILFSPDGSLLLSYANGAKDKSLKMWQVASGRLHLAAMPAAKYLRDAVFDPSGSRIAVACDNHVALYELFDKDVQRFRGQDSGPLATFDFLPRHGDLVCISEGNGESQLSFWNQKDSQPFAQFEMDGQLPMATGLALHPSGQGLVYLTNTLQKLPKHRPGRDIAMPFSKGLSPEGFTFSSCGRQLWSVSDATLSVHSWPGAKPIWNWRNLSTAGIPELTCLTAGNGSVAVGTRDGNVHLFSEEKPAWRTSITGSGVAISCVAFHPVASVLAVATRAGDLRLVNMATRQTLSSVKESDSAIIGLSFNSDGRFLATATQDGMVHVYDFLKGSLTPHVVLDMPGTVRKIAFHPNNSMQLGVLVEGESAVRMWQLDRLQDIFAGLKMNSRRIDAVEKRGLKPTD